MGLNNDKTFKVFCIYIYTMYFLKIHYLSPKFLDVLSEVLFLAACICSDVALSLCF